MVCSETALNSPCFEGFQIASLDLGASGRLERSFCNTAKYKIEQFPKAENHHLSVPL